MGKEIKDFKVIVSPKKEETKEWNVTTAEFQGWCKNKLGRIEKVLDEYITKGKK